MLLVKVSILGPEYLEEQLQGGPTHDPRKGPQQASSDNDSQKLEREVALAENFEHSADPSLATTESVPSQPSRELSPSQALRIKHQHLSSIDTLAKQFGARLVDVSENSVIVEMSGKTSRVEAFLSLVKPFGVLESARTGQCCAFTPIS